MSNTIYNKAGVDAKFDGLAPVASSGSYDDLINKPTIPTMPPAAVLTPVTADITPAAGAVAGELIGYENISAGSITVVGVTVAAGGWIILRWKGGTWGQVGASTASDTTPPTAGTMAMAADTTTASGAVTGALAGGANALADAPYRFIIAKAADVAGFSGAQWLALTGWSSWQASPFYTAWSGLTPSTSYVARHQVRDAAGNTKLGAAVTASTLAVPVYTTLSAATFDAVANGTLVDGLTPDVGATLACYADLGQGATRSTVAQIQSGKIVAPAATGTWQPRVVLQWLAGTTSYTRMRATIGYDYTGATGGAIRFAVASNSAMTNQMEVGVSPVAGTIYVNEYTAGTAVTVTEPSPPPIPKAGSIVVDVVSTGTSSVWRLHVGAILHSTVTLTGAALVPTAGMAIGTTGNEATGANMRSITDYKLEVSTS